MSKKIVAAKSEESSEGMGMMVLEGAVAFGAGVLVGRYLLPKQSTQAAFGLPTVTMTRSLAASQQASAAYQRGYSETVAWLRQNPGAARELATYGLTTGRGADYDHGRRDAWVASGRAVGLGQIVNDASAFSAYSSGSPEYRKGFEDTSAWMNQNLNDNSSANLADYGLTTGRGADYDLGRHEAWVEGWDARGWPPAVRQSKLYQAGRNDVLAWLQQNPGASPRLPVYGSVTGRGEFYDAGRRMGWLQYTVAHSIGGNIGVNERLYPVFGAGYP